MKARSVVGYVNPAGLKELAEDPQLRACPIYNQPIAPLTEGRRRSHRGEVSECE